VWTDGALRCMSEHGGHDILGTQEAQVFDHGNTFRIFGDISWTTLVAARDGTVCASGGRGEIACFGRLLDGRRDVVHASGTRMRDISVDRGNVCWLDSGGRAFCASLYEAEGARELASPWLASFVRAERIVALSEGVCVYDGAWHCEPSWHGSELPNRSNVEFADGMGCWRSEGGILCDLQSDVVPGLNCVHWSDGACEISLPPNASQYFVLSTERAFVMAGDDGRLWCRGCCDSQQMGCDDERWLPL
jgi:hypothetical protein